MMYELKIQIPFIVVHNIIILKNCQDQGHHNDPSGLTWCLIFMDKTNMEKMKKINLRVACYNFQRILL